MREGASDIERARHEEMTHELLKYQFNESLRVLDTPLASVSHDTISRCLEEFFPVYGVSPVQSDYCHTCAELKQQINSARRAKQHLLDSGSASVTAIQEKERIIESYDANLRRHREMATKEQEEYKQRISGTPEFFRRNILGREHNCNAQGTADLCLSSDPDSEVVLACDFKIGKLVPHWGQSAQPGKTYYYQKLMHHAFGIVDSSNSRKYVYATDETVAGDKNSDHVCSFIYDYVERILQPSARFLPLYLDAAPYFKTKFMVWWATEMVMCGRFRPVTLSYMVPGYTKFEPDSLFAQISNRFYKTDVFDTTELLHVIGACNVVPHQMAPRGLRRWKTSLASKYVDVPRITEWNVMVIEKETPQINASGGAAEVTLKVKRSVANEQCVKAFHGSSTALNLSRRGVEADGDGVPSETMSTANAESMRKPLSGDKLRNIADMYESYIPRHRWPAQLTQALHARTAKIDDNIAGVNVQSHVLSNAQHDSKAIRIGALIGSPDGAARAHTYLRRVDGARGIPDEVLAGKLRKAPDASTRTMPRRKRARLVSERTMAE